jgi:hypothetical protein
MATAEDIKIVGTEPVYKGEELGTEAYRIKLRDILRWNSYVHSAKDVRKYATNYVKNIKRADPEFVKEWVDFGETQVGLTVGIVAKLVGTKMPLTKQHQLWLDQGIAKAIAYGKKNKAEGEEGDETVVTTPKLTIQDRMAMQLNNIMIELQEFEEAVLMGETHNAHEVLNYLKTKAVPQISVPKIVAFYTPKLNELKEAQTTKDEDLLDAYSHYTKADFKRVIAFYSSLIDDCNHYHSTKKVQRATKKRKPVAKDKIVAKAKYMKQDETLKLVSINPVDIIGATQLFVFNVKTRKLGVYKAEEHGGVLSVKGTTIIGFDEVQSVQKTLRKPAEQLAEFKKAGKVALRTFLTDIKAVDIKLNGRLSEDVILLKVL